MYFSIADKRNLTERKLSSDKIGFSVLSAPCGEAGIELHHFLAYYGATCSKVLLTIGVIGSSCISILCLPISE
jgi:glucokinase